MTKIVINTAYGGFYLTEEATARYVELKGNGARKVESDVYVYWVLPDSTDFINENIDRDDPVLVQVVEELGGEVAGDSLEVVEIPAGTTYRIAEYDGKEWIEERDKIKWKIA
jgi:hypothetical protein